MVMDRDGVAVVNLARRGRVRFARSRPPMIEAQGGAAEAVIGNLTPTVIPGVDALKLTSPNDKLTEPAISFTSLVALFASVDSSWIKSAGIFPCEFL